MYQQKNIYPQCPQRNVSNLQLNFSLLQQHQRNVPTANGFYQPQMVMALPVHIVWFKTIFIHVHLVSSRPLPKSAVFTTDSDAKLYTSNAKYAWHPTTGQFVPKSIITWYPCFRSTTGIKFITGQIECTSDCSSMRWDIARTMSMHKNNTNDRAEIEKLTHRLESIRCQKQR